MKLQITLLIFLLFPIVVHSKDISGAYVASTSYGNIFCIDLVQQKEKIQGSFDEVDFNQIVPILNGVFKEDKLSFDVEFKIGEKRTILSMSANEIQRNPRIFFGTYLIGREKGGFVLYNVKSKPQVCKQLYKK